jgi:hypothetical protein
MIYCMILVVLQVNILRRMKPQYRLSFSRLVIVSQSATLSFMIAGFTLLVWGKNGRTTLSRIKGAGNYWSEADQYRWSSTFPVARCSG